MKPTGWLKTKIDDSAFSLSSLRDAFFRIDQPLMVLEKNGEMGAINADFSSITQEQSASSGSEVLGVVPQCLMENLGDSQFCRSLGIRFPLLGGSMAHGISSAEIVEALGKSGMMGFFGSAGLSPEKVEENINRISSNLGDAPYGFNLIHSPNEPLLEEAIVDLYLRRGVKLVEASAYLGMTLPLVKYRVYGIYRDEDGNVVTPNRVIAKISRIEVAAKFFAPPPQNFLTELVGKGFITSEQAGMAAIIPMAQDLTAEADSGGHTDNRPAVTLLPTIIALRDRVQNQYKYKEPLRVGLGGGIATPWSAAAAFAMGAAYIVTGSVNQSCVESGLSQAGREMLAQAQQADCAMAPAGDMFEMGVTVQVLKRGTMFAMRAAKLYELYRAYKSIDDIPGPERLSLEKTVFQMPLATVWQQTRDFFLKRDPSQVQQAEKDPKHLMALVFRWYLGQSPRWAVSGEPTRRIDFQIWCGPAMGAFNEWVKGTQYEPPANRRIVPIMLNLLYGAAVIQRLNCARTQGIRLPEEVVALPPVEENQIRKYIR